MKFSETTLLLLKNFSLINPAICLFPGNTIKTIAFGGSILAQAQTDIEFEREMAIPDLNKFMAAMSLFDDPDLEVTDKHIKIKNKATKATINFTLAAKSEIKLPPEKPFQFPNAEIGFTLTNEMFQGIYKAMGVLKLPEIAFTGDGKSLKVQAIDSEGRKSDSYDVLMGETDKTFQCIFKMEKLRLLPMDYYVEIARKRGDPISRFKGVNHNLEYFIGLEHTSKF